MTFLRPHTVALLTGVSLAVLASGCSDGNSKRVNVSYQETARANFEKGLQEFKRENYAEATKYFNFVKNRFPFSRFATLSELRMADALFQQERYLEAADAYRLFVRFHPTHAKVQDGYAAYQSCRAFEKQIPDSWLLAPPSYEKDQTATQEALRAVTAFIRAYPDSEYFEAAKTLRGKCIARLVQHELYVANFYLSRDKPKATALRLEGILKRYPDSTLSPRIMMLLGETYLKLKQRDEAERIFAALARKYPDDKRAKEARAHVESLRKKPAQGQ